MSNLTVVKVGGSLFDLPNLGPRLRQWRLFQPSGRYLYVPGGGPAADVVRSYHRTHLLPEEFSHALAIRMMDVNGVLLKELLGDDAEIPCIADLLRDDTKLERTWRVTSDSIAARIAEIRRASRLVMLKSVDLPAAMNWTDASAAGLVDAMFGEIVERAGLPVEWINFRAILV